MNMAGGAYSSPKRTETAVVRLKSEVVTLPVADVNGSEGSCHFLDFRLVVHNLDEAGLSLIEKRGVNLDQIFHDDRGVLRLAAGRVAGHVPKRVAT